jgi:hypothetical protein
MYTLMPTFVSSPAHLAFPSTLGFPSSIYNFCLHHSLLHLCQVHRICHSYCQSILSSPTYPSPPPFTSSRPHSPFPLTLGFPLSIDSPEYSSFAPCPSTPAFSLSLFHQVHQLWHSHRHSMCSPMYPLTLSFAWSPSNPAFLSSIQSLTYPSPLTFAWHPWSPIFLSSTYRSSNDQTHRSISIEGAV